MEEALKLVTSYWEIGIIIFGAVILIKFFTKNK